MGQKKKLGKTRLDKFYHLAKEQGYRSRAAFKLIQLNRKYDFLSGARSCLDLCAAPGGWLQVAVKTMPVGSLIVGVDLVPIRPVRGAKTFIGDITTTETRALLKRESGGALFDIVVHDGAPNVGGAWSSEAYSQSALALEALRLATDVLAPGGTFVTKVFRSKDYTPLMYAMKQLFKNVEATKPAASRSTSAEIFVVCQKFKAPSKIDPRLLDPKHLFQDVTEAPKVGGPDALVKQKQAQKRNREGYEDGLSSLHKTLAAVDFVLHSHPVEALGTCTVLDLNAPGSDADLAAEIRAHPATSAEVLALCADLQVLGRAEFKHLLKWRLAVRKSVLARRKAAAEAAPAEEERAAAESEEEDEEDKVLAEMEELKSKMDRESKKELKKKRELRRKAKVRSAQLALSEGIGEETSAQGLFSLPGLRTDETTLEGLSGAAVPSDDEVSEEEYDREQSSDDDLGSDVDEGVRYSAALERSLDRSYDAWQEGRTVKTRSGGEVVRKRRRRVGMDGELESEEEERENAQDTADLSRFDDDDESGRAGGGLVVELDPAKIGVAKTPEAAAAQWFAQDLFEDADLATGVASAIAVDPIAVDDAMDQQQVESEEEEDVEEEVAPERSGKARGTAPSSALRSAAPSADFEVVPVRADRDGSSSESDDEDELELLKDEDKAVLMALAKKMLRRKVKDDIVEAAYNRYAFHDTNLPRWFEDEERRFMRPIAPVTAEEAQEAREALRAVSARPMKKVAEAKARKAKRLNERLTKARQKAEAIAASEDGSASAKIREIERVYKDAHGGGKKRKMSRSEQYKKKGPHLDRRMKKDKRGMERAAARMKGKGKGAKGGRRR